MNDMNRNPIGTDATKVIVGCPGRGVPSRFKRNAFVAILAASAISAVAACYFNCNYVCVAAGSCVTTCGSTSCYDSGLHIWVSYPTGTWTLQDAIFPGVAQYPYACWDIPHCTSGQDSYVYWQASTNVAGVQKSVDTSTCTWTVTPVTIVVTCPAALASGNPCSGSVTPPPPPTET